MLRGIDLFAGVGGMTLGFNMGGIKTPVSLEIDAIASQYHRINFSDSWTIERDIKKVTGNELRKLISSHAKIFAHFKNSC